MMDNLRLLLFIFVVMPIAECFGHVNRTQCSNSDDTYLLLESESFVSLTLLDEYLEKENLTWYKNNSRIETLPPDEKERIYYNGTLFFLLNASTKDSDLYTGRRTYPSGKCHNYNLNITVLKESQKADPAILYGCLNPPELNKEVFCPITMTCERLGGDFTWYKDFKFLPGAHENSLWIKNASKHHEDIYTCICTWTHNHKAYNTSGSRWLIVDEPNEDFTVVEILSPTNKEQFADEGSTVKLNCTVLCGKNMKQDCIAEWEIKDGDPSMDAYNQTMTLNTEEPSKATTATAVLTIYKVSALDFQANFSCKGQGVYTTKIVSLRLKRRESIIPLVITAVCVLFVSALALLLVKCFVIDLTLLFRPCVRLFIQKNDARFYDAYVVYQTRGMDKETEGTLGRFVTQILPSVLEEKCGYRLFIQGRDDIPGQDRVLLVEDSMKQSKRLMVILISPGSGPESETTDHHSPVEGFDWQMGIHHVLVQREMSVILIQLGDTGPQGYKDFPIGLQHLIGKSAPLSWSEGSRDAAAWNSYFWKRVRYLMPISPSKKYPQATIV